MSIGLVVEIIGDASKLGTELGKTQGPLGGFMNGIGGTAMKLGVVAGAAGIAAETIMDWTSAAAEDAAEQERLQAALEAAGVATGDYTTKVDAAIAAGQERAFTDTQTRDALQSLVTATGDLDLATEELAIAQDVARFANVDLATAADAVAKANAGQDGALRKLMPGLEKGTTATDTLAAATEAAAGQADAYADSTAGMQERAGDAFTELTETIGSAFIPILEELLPVIIPVIQQIAELVEELLPIMIPLVKASYMPFKILVNVLGFAVDVLMDLVNWLKNAIDQVGAFLESVNPFKDLKLPDIPFLSSGGGRGSASRAGVGRSAVPLVAGEPGLSGLTVNVYTTGDTIEAEQAVVRALRRVTRLNGGVVPAVGWTGA
jgi:hypothetical protein